MRGGHRRSARSGSDSRAPTVSTIASTVRADVPRRLPRRVAVPEQVGRERRGSRRAPRRGARSADRGCGRRGGRRRAASPDRPTRGARASLRDGERFERVRHHLGATLVALLHERPDHVAVAVDEERAAMRRAGRLVEDAVRLRRGAVRPEVGRERVLGAELASSTPGARPTDRTRRRRSPCRRRGTTAGSPGGRAPRPRTPRVNAKGWKTRRTFERPRKSGEPHALAVASPPGRTRVPRHLSSPPSACSSPAPDGR